MHFDHQQASEAPQQGAKSIAWNARLGLWFFFIYTAFYCAFVLISAFALAWLATPLFGIPASVTVGFGLIFGALVLALLYARACTSD